ncbi:MAG TPA: glycine cleavage system protein GcvH [Burkholderiaceae bacterium]|nr:glycine cleavage system protein GcvH [Burkholderiaceae bacterium]
MNVPAELRYTASHEWVRKETDGTVTIGITDFAQEALGDVVFVELPEIGRKVAAEEACAVVESVKAASDIYAPLAGVVTATNNALVDKPESINADAYAAWMFRMKPDEAGALDALLAPEAYKQNVAAQK